jgi:AGCS family alanine or glycine:cation symporter
MGQKWLAVLFAIFTVIACFGIGNLVQANAITQNVENTFGVSPIITGLCLAGLTFVVIMGGLKAIVKVAQGIIRFMAVAFFVSCFYILILNSEYIMPALSLIFTSAFSQQAIEGGLLGYAVQQAIRFGIARGLFSNEAGLGSAPIAAASAATSNPGRQGLVSMSQVFWDTIILCFTTGTMYVTCILKYPDRFIVTNAATGARELVGGALFASSSFQSIHPTYGPMLLTFILFLFAWTTILGWEYYGERCLEYMGGKVVIVPFRIIYGIVVFVGSITALNLVWDISDAFNALMAIPNLISLIALTGVIVICSKEFLWDKGGIDKVDPTPIPEIKN